MAISTELQELGIVSEKDKAAVSAFIATAKKDAAIKAINDAALSQIAALNKQISDIDAKRNADIAALSHAPAPAE